MVLRKGTVLWGINNIYQVAETQGKEYLCRIKGKVLGGRTGSTSPLLPGDRVAFLPGEHEGMITDRLERKNQFQRYNLRRREIQTLFVNVDQIICVVSVNEPKMKPGFIDRVILCAQDIPVAIVCNKTDLPAEEETQHVLQVYESLGFPVYRICAADGRGFEKLLELLKGRRSACFGPSGVGKSSMINRLIPEASREVGEISRRYNKGRHTTNYSILLRDPEGAFELIDSPGVREIEVPTIMPEHIALMYPEMAELAGMCRFSSCLHIHEPQCAVREAVNSGVIDQGRYQRYAKIVEEQFERSRWQ